MKSGVRSAILGTVTALAGCALVVGLASGQGEAPQGEQLARDVFTNVRVLGDIPVDEFMDTMGMIANALGMCCVDCHTTAGLADHSAYAVDTDMKRRARGMIVMMNNINRNSFGGESRVTCFTCHRGTLSPEAPASLMTQYSAPPEDPNAMRILPAFGGPSPEEIFARFFEQTGGEDRLGEITSMVARGTYNAFDTAHNDVPLDVYAEAPAKRATIVHAFSSDKVTVFDGNNGWVSASDRPVGLMQLTGGNLAGVRLEALMSFPTLIPEAFSEWEVGFAAVDGRDVQVLQGRNEGELPINLYFDEEGLLMRMVRWTATALGPVPTQIDYSDYQEVSGVRVPFHWMVTWTFGQANYQFEEVELNVPIDQAMFAQPEPAELYIEGQ